jgi:hypothetical protein
MKEQEIVGWKYPCEDKFKVSAHLNLYNKFVLLIGIDVHKRKKDLLIDNFRQCVCGKNCKPIKVKITVEPIS